MSDTHMISREEAVEALYDIINSGIISNDLEDTLEEIAQCIKDEEDLGIHAWDMPKDDEVRFHTAIRNDIPEYKENLEKCKELVEEWGFIDKKAGN